MEGKDEPDPLASIQEILERHKKRMEESPSPSREHSGRRRDNDNSSSLDQSPEWDLHLPRDHSTSRSHSRGHSSSRDHSSSRSPSSRDHSRPHSRASSYDRLGSREHSLSRHSSMDRNVSRRSDGSESPGPSRGEESLEDPDPDKEILQPVLPGVKIDYDDHLDDMRKSAITEEPKPYDSSIKDEAMSASQSEDDLDGDEPMVEGSPPVRREKRKRAVSDLSTESEGDILDMALPDLDLPGARNLTHDHLKHRIALSKAGSLANRRRPTKRNIQKSVTAGLYASPFDDPSSPMEDIDEEASRYPSGGYLSSPAASPRIERKIGSDGPASQSAKIKVLPPPVLGKPAMKGGVLLPVALPGAAGPKLRSTKQPVPELNSVDRSVSQTSENKLKKSPPKVVEKPVGKSEKIEENDDGKVKPQIFPKHQGVAMPGLQGAPAVPEKPRSKGWFSGLKSKSSPKKEREQQVTDEIVKKKDDTPSWKAGLKKPTPQKAETADSPETGAKSWLGGLKKSPKPAERKRIDPEQKSEVETSVPGWMSETKKVKKPPPVPPKEKPSIDSKSGLFLERVKLKKSTPGDSVDGVDASPKPHSVPSSTKKSDIGSSESISRTPAVEDVPAPCDVTLPGAAEVRLEAAPLVYATAHVESGPFMSPQSETGPEILAPVPTRKISEGLELTPPSWSKVDVGRELSPIQPSKKGNDEPESSPQESTLNKGPEMVPPSTAKIEKGLTLSPIDHADIENSDTFSQQREEKSKPLRTVTNDRTGKNRRSSDSQAVSIPWMQETKVRRNKSFKDENKEKVKADGENKPAWMKDVLQRRRKTQERLHVRDKAALEHLAEQQDKEPAPSKPPAKNVPLKQVCPETSNITPSQSLLDSNKTVESQNKANVSRSRQSSVGSSVGSDHELILSYIDNQDDTQKLSGKKLEIENVTTKASSTDASPRDKDTSPRRGNGDISTRIGDENVPPHVLRRDSDLRRSSDTGVYSSPFSRAPVLPPIKSPPPGPQTTSSEKENTESIPSWKAEIAARRNARKLSLPRADEALKPVEIPIWKKELEEKKKEKPKVQPPEEESTSSSSVSSSSLIPPWKQELAQRRKKGPLSPKSNEASEIPPSEPAWMKQVSERRKQRLASSGLMETSMDSSQC